MGNVKQEIKKTVQFRHYLDEGVVIGFANETSEGVEVDFALLHRSDGTKTELFPGAVSPQTWADIQAAAQYAVGFPDTNDLFMDTNDLFVVRGMSKIYDINIGFDVPEIGKGDAVNRGLRHIHAIQSVHFGRYFVHADGAASASQVFSELQAVRL